jgi:hypothetical protein
MHEVNLAGAFAFIALLATGICAHAADPNSAASSAPMKMDEPMPSKMAKQGTKKGDVKKSAEKKERRLKPMLEKESAGEAKKR